MDNEEPKIKIHVTVERMQRMKVGVFRKAETSISARFEFIAHFVTNGSGWMEKDAAMKLLDDLEMGEIDAIALELREGMEQLAIPNQ